MAAVIFSKTISDDGLISTTMICAKTKVAPIKCLSIPRLELTAALLLSRLMKMAIKALKVFPASINCWKDSAVALYWVNSLPSRWKGYVQNRVLSIQEILPNCTWKFVPGKQNPADCTTRGVRPNPLTHLKLWWQGPDWLAKEKPHWPTTPNQLIVNAHLEEKPKRILVALTASPSYWYPFYLYSLFNKLLRVIATCRRFIQKLWKLPNTSTIYHPLILAELNESRIILIGLVQRTKFAYKVRFLSRSNSLPSSSPLLKLIPYLDCDGLLRVGGRLNNSILDENKHPFILLKRSPFTSLIIENAHLKTLHGGTQLTLSHTRMHYWIINGRTTVRAHILKCVRCARYRATRAKQIMGQLPTSRVTMARPFTNSGLDYAGPLTLQTWRGRAAKTYKGYLAIFICMATSAVHVEVVTDYSSNAFIAAYKRFTGRRGICLTLQSDCGTNFTGADAELRKLFDSASAESKEFAALLSNDGTYWKFNSLAAPHFGGKWEVAVKPVKFHLKRILGIAVLTYEELNTVVVQIDTVLNSRPLCPFTEDSSDLSILTPGHFLTGNSLTAIPEPDLTTVPISRLTRWQLLRQLLDKFWRRWSTECLQRFQAISKWHHPFNAIKVGSLVLMTDERFPPGKWPLAKVTQLHPGADGYTRVVTLKTATSEYKRPVAKICLLPTERTEEISSNPLSKAGGMLKEPQGLK